MPAATRRWLIFTALCALLLLSLPAKYGRAEGRAHDRAESACDVQPERWDRAAGLPAATDPKPVNRSE